VDEENEEIRQADDESSSDEATQDVPSAAKRPKLTPGAVVQGESPSAGWSSPQRKAEYAYVIGEAVEMIWPSPDFEWHFKRASRDIDSDGLTDRQTLHEVLSQQENRYLLRAAQPVLTVGGAPKYLLRIDDEDTLLDAAQPRERPVYAAIGVRVGPGAPDGLALTTLYVTLMYSCEFDELVDAWPRPDGMPDEQFRPAAQDLFERIVRQSGLGQSDADRVLNCAVLSDPAIHHTAATQYAREFSVTRVEARPSPLSNGEHFVDILMATTNRKSGYPETFCSRWNATWMLPFPVAPMAPCLER
jgi:hypothetical protein